MTILQRWWPIFAVPILRQINTGRSVAGPHVIVCAVGLSGRVWPVQCIGRVRMEMLADGVAPIALGPIKSPIRRLNQLNKAGPSGRFRYRRSNAGNTWLCCGW